MRLDSLMVLTVNNELLLLILLCQCFILKYPLKSPNWPHISPKLLECSKNTKMTKMSISTVIKVCSYAKVR